MKPVARSELPKATAAETVAVMTEVFVPNVAKGVILRRPHVVAMTEKLELDTRAVKRIQSLRDRYGSGPLMLRLPIRNQAVILDPAHVRRVLDETPDPFSTASSEKRAALAHFEPKVALITPPGSEREARRRFNEQVLESGNPMHQLAEQFVGVVEQEAESLLRQVRDTGGRLDWDTFIEAWFRVVRRVVFGDGARDDHELRDILNDLRADANWAFLKPKNDRLRKRFLARLNGHLKRAEPGSLASIMASRPTRGDVAPDHQVPQWLFAFDPAGMTSFRALALLATHPGPMERAQEEAARTGGASAARPLPYLRACVLESLRLWPTTPMVLRETTVETTWDGAVMPAGTGVLLFAPFFHRDEERLPYAHRFAPEVWLEEGEELQGRPPRDWPLIPFSGGPAICPGRNLVLLLTSHMLATLVRDREVRLEPPAPLNPDRPLPGTLNNYGLRFRVRGDGDRVPAAARRSALER
jgi:cytochrome P450